MKIHFKVQQYLLLREAFIANIDFINLMLTLRCRGGVDVRVTGVKESQC